MRHLIRPYREADASAAVAFVADAQRDDPTLVPVSEEGWRAFTGKSFNQGARGFAVAEADGAIDALLMSHRKDDRRQFRIIVHPRARRRGLGTRLLEYVESLDDDPVAHEAGLPEDWAAGRAFLARAGFAEERCDFEMERRGPPPERVPPPPGIVLRAYAASAADDEAWTRLNDEGFGGGPGHSKLTPNDLALARASEGFHLWLAVRGDEIVGYCHTEIWQGHTPTLYGVVVASSERGNGLGRALTVAGLRALPEGPVALWVLSDNAPALAIYRSLGFEVKKREATWLRPAF